MTREPIRCVGPAARLALIASLAATAAGCSTFLPTAIKQPPPHLYQLPADRPTPPGLRRVAGYLVVDAPFAPQALDSSRIALKPNALQIEYYADSRWDDRAPAVVQTALVKAFEKSGVVLAVGRPSLGLTPDFTLKSELWDFEAVYASLGTPPTALVVLSVKLMDKRENAVIASQIFRGQARAEADSVAAAVQAFDSALGDVVARIVPWAVRAMSAEPGPRQVKRGGPD